MSRRMLAAVRVAFSPVAGQVDPVWWVPGFSLGVLSLQWSPQLPSLGLLVLLTMPALLPWRWRPHWAALVLGLLLATLQAQRLLAERWPADRHGDVRDVSGFVASLPERQNLVSGEAQTWRFLFRPDAPEWPRGIRVSWYRSDVVLRGGQCWRLRLRLRTPHGSVNWAGFDYEAWLMRSGIGATATVLDGQPCVAAGHQGNAVLRLRQRVVDRIHAVLGDTPSAALLAALSVGDTSGLSDADWERFRRTGTTHLIAISGFNLAIVAGFVFFLLRWCWSVFPRLCLCLPAQTVGLIGSALAAVGYALMAGFEPPVTRALIMLLIVSAALLLHRRSAAWRGLAYAWVVILLLDPLAVLSPGLWLSFGAVAAIFYVTLGRRRPAPAWQLALKIQVFLSLLLTPLTIAFFGGFAWLSPVLNLVAVPVFSVLTPLALLSVLAATVSDALGGWLLPLAAMPLGWVDAVLAWAAQAPEAWRPFHADAATLLLAGLGLLLLFAPRGLPIRPLGVMALLPLFFPLPPRVAHLQVTALDVGQGLAVIVRTREHTLLFDAGPAFAGSFDAGRSVVVPELLRQGVRRLDRIIVSHGDNDHAGGVAAVRQVLPVGDILGDPLGEACQAGERWRWDGVDFELLHPSGPQDEADNNASCVLKIDGVVSVLLPGDIEWAAERALLARHPDRLRTDLLLAPHHGSATSSTQAFVDAVQPRWVVFSAGWRHRYGHPRANVVARYRHAGATLLTTGVVGGVRFTVMPDGRIDVAQARSERPRWWRAPMVP